MNSDQPKKKTAQQIRKEEALALQRYRQMQAIRETFRQAGKPVPVCYDADAPPAPSTDWSTYEHQSKELHKAQKSKEQLITNQEGKTL